MTLTYEKHKKRKIALDWHYPHYQNIPCSVTMIKLTATNLAIKTQYYYYTLGIYLALSQLRGLKPFMCARVSQYSAHSLSISIYFGHFPQFGG